MEPVESLQRRPEEEGRTTPALDENEAAEQAMMLAGLAQANEARKQSSVSSGPLLASLKDFEVRSQLLVLFVVASRSSPSPSKGSTC